MAKLAPVAQGVFDLGLSQAGQKVLVTLVDETDLATFETGISSPTIELSKNGAAYASPSDGTWAEVSDGDYTITLNATDTDTLGWLSVRVIKSGTSAETRILCNIGISNEEQRNDYLRTRAFRRS
tara:strand:- start:519 stop:893 length:375 start_codon:yes stop_codon:yes gene_type:complete